MPLLREFNPEKVMVWERSAHENDRKSKYGGPARELMGYGSAPPSGAWPKGAKVALNFVINYEEGGERCILHGDNASESLLSDIPGAVPLEGQRNMNMESMYEYGSRAGFWRLHRLFNKVSHVSPAIVTRVTDTVCVSTQFIRLFHLY